MEMIIIIDVFVRRLRRPFWISIESNTIRFCPRIASSFAPSGIHQVLTLFLLLLIVRVCSPPHGTQFMTNHGKPETEKEWREIMLETQWHSGRPRRDVCVCIYYIYSHGSDGRPECALRHLACEVEETGQQTPFAVGCRRTKIQKPSRSKFIIAFGCVRCAARCERRIQWYFSSAFLCRNGVVLRTANTKWRKRAFDWYTLCNLPVRFFFYKMNGILQNYSWRMSAGLPISPSDANIGQSNQIPEMFGTI